MDLKQLTDVIGQMIDAVGIVIIAVGLIISTVVYVFNFYQKHAYTHYRQLLGKVILLGLEFLIAGDIIRSVVVEPSFRNVGILALIVLIRTILSMALQMEITGRWPWQGKEA